MGAGKSFKVVVVGLFLAASALAPVAKASDADCEKPHDTQPTETFAVSVRALEDVYRVGETAEFRVKVTRELHGHVVGPAEDADVFVTVDLGDVVFSGGAITDAEGKAVVKVLLKSYAPTGLADVFVYAHKDTADLPCHSELEHEFGDVQKNDLFRVVR